MGAFFLKNTEHFKRKVNSAQLNKAKSLLSKQNKYFSAPNLSVIVDKRIK